MTSDDLTGKKIVAIWHASLPWAANKLLLALGRERLRDHLKIHSGEHLAAILTTAFLGTAPRSIDVEGGVDLTFELKAGHHLLGDCRSAAFEVKSMGDRFRKFRSSIDQMTWRGQDPSGLRSPLGVVQTADDILIEARPILAAAARQLKAKVGDSASKHAFLIIHPFDRLAIEVIKYDLIAPFLAPLTDVTGLDTVWVLWAPDDLAMWSSEEGVWTELFFRAIYRGEMAELSFELSPLQDVESRFLAQIDHAGSSPYLFDFEVEGPSA